MICVELTTVKLLTVTPLPVTVTAVAPVRPVPVSVTDTLVPRWAVVEDVGLIEVNVNGSTRKLMVAVPPAVVTVRGLIPNAEFPPD